jgi:hypothetical protein
MADQAHAPVDAHAEELRASRAAVADRLQEKLLELELHTRTPLEREAIVSLVNAELPEIRVLATEIVELEYRLRVLDTQLWMLDGDREGPAAR